jgi:hypothetical protein
MPEALVTLFAMTATLAAGQTPPVPADVAFFEAKVRPLLVERCHACHSTKAKKQRGGLLLDNRPAILAGGDSGPALVPGHPESSLLVKAVHYTGPDLQMPPTGRLPAHEVAVLEAWIKRGAPFPGPAVAAGTQKTVNIAAGRTFWSFQPLRESAPGETKQKGWAQRRIDNFLLAAMEKRGLAPSPAASRETLIRRVAFDLVGLPPTPEEVEAFVKDTSPRAYEQLVERLLASPHYGERWARHWLDLARYADVTESWADSKGSPYVYRDWVVRAINDDLPYDRFVQRQLAADLLPGAAPADRAALGFLGLSPTYWKELKLDHNVIKTVVAEEWEERIQAITGTFLGLTVACARCHDHKFDPITQQDYYGLAGVLNSTRLADCSLLSDDRAAAARKARTAIGSLETQVKKLQTSKDKSPETVKRIDDLRRRIADVRKATPDLDVPLVPGVAEASLHVLPDGPHKTKLVYKPGEALDVPMQIRGNPANAGPVVPRRFLAVLSPESPVPFKKGSGRLGLARAITTDAAPLAARVFVNRVWKYHFGTGLVETPSDFGAQGERPSHPALLDDLAARFVKNGWSLKWLHREIVLSAAYQQSSHRDPDSEAIDPDNRLLWRMNRRRLDVEAWRDAILAVSGTLDPKLGGPPQELSDPANRRRTLYGTVKRRELNDLLRLHDFPDPVTHSPARVPTTTPLQQLFTLNSPFLQQHATAFAHRVWADAPANNEARIRRAYRLVYGRPATADDVRIGLAFLAGNDALWPQYAQVLLGSNEAIFVD